MVEEEGGVQVVACTCQAEYAAQEVRGSSQPGGGGQPPLLHLCDEQKTMQEHRGRVILTRKEGRTGFAAQDEFWGAADNSGEETGTLR